MEPLTRDELLERILLLQEEANSIKGQIQSAKAKGKPDQVWISKAAHALRSKNQQVQRLQMEARKLRQLEHKNRVLTLESAFVSAARAKLPSEVFEELLFMANSVASKEFWEIRDGN